MSFFEGGTKRALQYRWDTNTLAWVPWDGNVSGAVGDRVSASAETSTVFNGTTELTPKFAAINASASGANTLVAAVVGKKIRVLAVVFVAGGSVTAKFQNGAGGTDVSGPFTLAAGGGAALPFNPVGWFETGINTLLNMNLTSAVAVGGCVVYVEV